MKGETFHAYGHRIDPERFCRNLLRAIDRRFLVFAAINALVCLRSADDYTRGYMNSKAMVSYDGNVFWPPPTKFRSTCPVDVTYFPFDDQTCVMKLGSWTYDGFQVAQRARLPIGRG